jgi:hypothetical protein
VSRKRTITLASVVVELMDVAIIKRTMREIVTLIYALGVVRMEIAMVCRIVKFAEILDMRMASIVKLLGVELAETQTVLL